MSKIEQTKRDYKENVQKDFDALIVEWDEDGHRHKEEILSDALIILKTYFDHMRELDDNEPCFNIEAWIDRLMGEKTYQTFYNNYRLGCFLYALTRFNCSALEARIATIEYLGSSDKTYINALNLFEKRIHNKDMDADEFLSIHAHTVKSVIENASNNFPGKRARIKNATIAFDKLISMLDYYTKYVD